MDILNAPLPSRTQHLSNGVDTLPTSSWLLNSSSAPSSAIAEGSAAQIPSDPPSIPPEFWPVELLHKWRGSRDPLPSGYWDDDLKNRDYVRPFVPTDFEFMISANCIKVFYVDDSTTMRPHWNQLIELSHSLAYLVKHFDSNGFDLYYTHSSESIRSSWKSTDLASNVRQQEPPKSPKRYTDIETKLGSFLDDYRQRIENYHRRTSGFFHRDVKRMLVIVLTDGKWQPHSDEAIEGTLRRLASTLRECKRNPKQIGVQFIRFGDDPDAQRRLDRLDNELGLGPYDIVDTEPADGNGLKMLLGPINKWLDHINERPPSSTIESGSPGFTPVIQSTPNGSPTD
jgi:hypothetical protein